MEHNAQSGWVRVGGTYKLVSGTCRQARVKISIRDITMLIYWILAASYIGYYATSSGCKILY